MLTLKGRLSSQSNIRCKPRFTDLTRHILTSENTKGGRRTKICPQEESNKGQIRPLEEGKVKIRPQEKHDVKIHLA